MFINTVYLAYYNYVEISPLIAALEIIGENFIMLIFSCVNNKNCMHSLLSLIKQCELCMARPHSNIIIIIIIILLCTVAQKGHPSLQFFKVTFCKLAVFQFCTFANMQFVNQALLHTCCLLIYIQYPNSKGCAIRSR